MHVLLDDDRGGLTHQRLWPWHRVLAVSQAARLDRALAAGISPETSACLAVRAVRLTSTEFRRGLAASLRRTLVAVGESALVPAPLRVARPPLVPLRATGIGPAAPLLAELANRLLEPGPVPVRGVAMVTELLSDGHGPLYHERARDDLSALAERAVQALTW
jgi:hypothetical protein